MPKKQIIQKLTLAAAAIMLCASPAYAEVTVGAAAPDFTATTVKGDTFKLADTKGKITVLEWNNPGCPFVVKHYGSGNMQSLQKTATEKDVTWVTINSSAPGKEGHQTAADAAKAFSEAGATPTAHILDESGAIGKLYGASVTPHMFVLDKEGKVAYMGAIDDNASPREDVIKSSKNYVLAAIDDVAAGRPVATPVTQPYGCGVKYGAEPTATDASATPPAEAPAAAK